MQNKCTISEHTSSIWRALIIGGLTVSVLFVLLLVLSDDALAGGIFRLIAFGGFAVVMLSYLHIRGKAQKIELRFDKERLIITYFSESKKTQEELFELETISSIIRIENPPVWKILPRNDCSRFMISFTDRNNTLSLFRFEGRDLCLSHPDAAKTEKFLDEYLNKH